LQSSWIRSRSGQAGVVSSRLFAVLLDPLPQRAGRSGQLDRKRYRAAPDLEVFNHAEAHDIPVDLGILDFFQRLEHDIFGYCFHHSPFTVRRKKL